MGGKWKAVWAFNNANPRSADKIFLAVEAATTGWVGFALAEAAGMRGADVSIYTLIQNALSLGNTHTTSHPMSGDDGICRQQRHIACGRLPRNDEWATHQRRLPRLDHLTRRAARRFNLGYREPSSGYRRLQRSTDLDFRLQKNRTPGCLRQQ